MSESRRGLKRPQISENNRNRFLGIPLSEEHRSKLKAAWDRRKEAGIENRLGNRKPEFDLLPVVELLGKGVSIYDIALKFHRDARTLKKRLMEINAWPCSVQAPLDQEHLIPGTIPNPEGTSEDEPPPFWYV
jgi:hypothetical protein